MDEFNDHETEARRRMAGLPPEAEVVRERIEMSVRRHEALMAVEKAFGPERAAQVIERTVAVNPRLRGAHFSDILDMADDHDACLRQTEPFYDAGHADVIESALLDAAIPESHTGQLISYSLLALALLDPVVPDRRDVLRLAIDAGIELKREMARG